MLKSLAVVIFIFIMFTTNAFAQQTNEGANKIPPLNGKQKFTLSLLIKEAVDAHIEARAPRPATVEPRLTLPQPMVASIYVDEKLRGRAWSLKPSQPLHQNLYFLINEAINKSKIKSSSLTNDELSKCKVLISLLSNYQKAADDRDVPPHSAVIIYNAYVEWLALPSDIKSSSAADLLSYACQQAGLRPNIWMLPETSIFSASVDDIQKDMQN